MLSSDPRGAFTSSTSTNVDHGVLRFTTSDTCVDIESSKISPTCVSDIDSIQEMMANHAYGGKDEFKTLATQLMNEFQAEVNTALHTHQQMKMTVTTKALASHCVENGSALTAG